MSDPQEILEYSSTVAVVGCSKDPSKAAHEIPRQLQEAGFRVIPVNPTATEILGERAYASLGDVPEQVDLVDVFRPAAETPGVVEQAVAIGARAVWLQLGIASPEARRIAEEAGLDYVEDRCAGVERRRHGIVKATPSG